MKFKKFSQYLEKIEQTGGRTEMTLIMVEMLKEMDPLEVKNAMYLLMGRLAPLYINIEFNFSRKLILRALDNLNKFLHVDSKIEDSLTFFNKHGDCGLVAQIIMEGKAGADDTIMQIYSELEKIAFTSGKGSVEQKMKNYLELIAKLDPISAKFATRIIEGNIRLGLSDKTLLDAFSWFIKGDKSIRGLLDTAYGRRQDIGFLAKTIIETPKTEVEKKLLEIQLVPFTPVASKLVEREIEPSSVWKRMPHCFVQPKLDGLRGQIHLQNNQVKIFSRNMEEMTDQFPEIILAVKSLGVDSIILDSEIIGINLESGNYRTYQETMKRKRKYEIENHAMDIPVSAMCFDLLYLNGKDLTLLPLEERITTLKNIIPVDQKNIKFLETIEINSEEELAKYYFDKIGSGLEGIIIKEKGTIYDAGTRNFKWIKLKANARTELVDTIDATILGFYTGRGDRSRFGFGALLLGVYNEEDGKYYSIGKVGSGFKDDDMAKMFTEMNLLKINSEDHDFLPSNYVVNKSLFPENWIEPKIIIEIIADEITRSPAHTAAIGIKTSVKNDLFEKGLSVRFPRLKRWGRDKLLPTTVKELIRMYELRKNKQQ